MPWRQDEVAERTPAAGMDEHVHKASLLDHCNFPQHLRCQYHCRRGIAGLPEIQWAKQKNGPGLAGAII
jgi:hypothetical protein